MKWLYSIEKRTSGRGLPTGHLRSSISVVETIINDRESRRADKMLEHAINLFAASARQPAVASVAPIKQCKALSPLEIQEHPSDILRKFFRWFVRKYLKDRERDRRYFETLGSNLADDYWQLDHLRVNNPGGSITDDEWERLGGTLGALYQLRARIFEFKRIMKAKEAARAERVALIELTDSEEEDEE